jgi:hypothetical protein
MLEDAEMIEVVIHDDTSGAECADSGLFSSGSPPSFGNIAGCLIACG